MAHKKSSLKKKQPLQSPNAARNPFRSRFGCDFGLDFAFMCPGMPFDGNTDKESSLGGSETACLQMARALSNLGNQVMVYCNTLKPGNYDGVEYIHIGENGLNWREFSSSIAHDISVVQRVPQAIGTWNASRMTWLWQHDLLLKPGCSEIQSAQWQMDRLVVPSEYMKRQYMEVGGLQEESFFVTTNGLDYSIIDEVLNAPRPKRNPKRLAYSARPERGLEILLSKVMPKLLERDPSYELHVYGYDNPISHLEGFYQHLRQMVHALGHNATWHSPLSKPALYREYLRAGAYVYPTGFYEISCISAMECMALGLPFISSRIGALPETLHPEAGVLLSAKDIGIEEGDPVSGYESVSYARDDKYVDRFVDEILAVTQNEDISKKMADVGMEYAKRFSWDNVAVGWVDEIMATFDKWTANRGRVARHFWWLGDHCAASRLWAEDLDEDEIEAGMDLEDRLELKDFLLDDEKRACFYAEISRPEPGIAVHAWREQRYQYLIDWLREKVEAGEVSATSSVLDFGCAHGGFSVGIAKEFEQMSVDGIDVAPACVEAAIGFAEQHKVANRTFFRVGDEDSDLHKEGEIAEWYDILICFDVLEHVPDPVGYLTKVMRHVKEGGWVLVSVPHGNGDVTSERILGVLGCHLHSFDRHCIRDIFSQQDDWKWAFLGGAKSKLDLSPQGWYLTAFRKSDKPLGEVNWERKKTILTPRQTVTGHIIAFNSEAIIGRAIRSIAPYCDDVDVLDTGSKDDTIAVAEKYGCRVFKGQTNPVTQGFETTRNEALAYARGDWILWVDTDEELCNGINLGKYLRNNTLSGYSLRQHHFSVEPPGAFNPDLPIRVFRRTWPDGTPSGLFWYGMIHEHVETGINQSCGPSLVLSDVDIAHDGYFTEAVRRNRFGRNFQMLLADRFRYPHRQLGAFIELRDCCHISRYLMRDPTLLSNYAIQEYFKKIGNESGGPVGNVYDAQKLVYERVIALYEQAILPLAGGEGTMINEALEYYTEACRFLGIGVEWKFAVQASRVGPEERLHPENIVHARFKDKDAAAKYVLARIASQSEPFEGPFA